TNSTLSPRFRALQGQTIWDANGNALVTSSWQLNPNGDEERYVVLYDQSTATPGTFGGDNIAGGADNDVVFGQLGNDTIQGDGTHAAGDDAGRPSCPGQAHDAGTVLGDNGDIFALVGANGFLTFNYDTYASTERIIPRAYSFLDYTPGNPAAAGTIGAADLI